ncbi:MAG: protein kinase [Planctomycetia bacterium]|nr:protein kinase [Planctomycetia bacterium]
MAVSTVQEFLQLLEKSTLLSADQIAQVWKWPEDQPKAFAARLVQENLLTAWQKDQLLAGKGSRSQFFLGKYKKLELIGLGGMGAVYRAVQPGIGRTVALKVMHKQVLQQPKAIERFLREIRSAAAVDDPNIVRAYDANCENDTYYLVMEYAAGKNLKSWIKEQKSLPIGWSCECIRQAALGLQHAHELGMLHRDIKPSNLLVTQGDDGLPVVKILDLGLARFASEAPQDGELTKSGQVLGTPDYMAPEQARDSKSADIRADIFSLGCTLFELLTGKLPFGGSTIMEKLMARATEDARPLRSLRSDIPLELEAIVARMLSRDPNQRYSTPADVAQALAPYSVGTAGKLPPRPAAKGPATDPLPTLDAHTDSTFKALHAEITSIAAQKHAANRSSGPESAQPRWLKTAAALVAAVLVLVVVATLVGKKKSPTGGNGDSLQSSAKDSTEGNSHDASDDSDASSESTARQAARRVFKLGGTVEVAVGQRRGTPRSGSARWAGLDRQMARSVGELPKGNFEIAAVRGLGGISLDARDLRDLARLGDLESLSLAENRFSDPDLAELSKLKSLERLDLADTPISDAGVAHVVNIPALKALDLSRTRISGRALESLASLRSLTELSLAGNRIRDGDLRELKKLPQLAVLNLAATDVQGPGLQNLRSLQNLKSLNLNGIPMRDRAIRHLSGLESLEILRLTGAKVTDDDLRLLSGVTKLKELVLASTQVTGDGLKHLTWMNSLERLDLHETFVADPGLRFLKELAALKELRLRRTLISDRGVKLLEELKNLQVVDLAETKVTQAGVNSLQSALPKCKIEF